jgi:hypothetical protein
MWCDTEFSFRVTFPNTGAGDAGYIRAMRDLAYTIFGLVASLGVLIRNKSMTAYAARQGKIAHDPDYS